MPITLMSDTSSHDSVQTGTSGTPTPPPLPMAAQAPIAQPTAPLLRIPGMVDETGPKQIEIKGKPYSVADIISLAGGPNERARLGAIKMLGTLEGLNRSELHLATSTLLSIHRQHPDLSVLASQSLHHLLMENSGNLEAIYLGIQVVKRWGKSSEAEATYSQLTAFVSDTVSSIRLDPSLSKKQVTERRFVLLKAVEVDAVQDAACEGISAILCDSGEQHALDRRELAANLLAYLRATNSSSPKLTAAKRLASSIIATGATSASHERATPVDVDRLAVCTTALQCEVRRQFGLACAIEMSKAVKLLGRSMHIEEYERAIVFSPVAIPALPANLSWFSKEEWQTTARLLGRASVDPDLDPQRVAALIQTLATRIKAEDPHDPRESRRRSDRIPSEERKRLLSIAERLRIKSDTSPDEFQALIDDVVRRNLPTPFDSWRFEPTSEAKKQTPRTDGSDEQLTVSQRASKLIKLLMHEENPTFIARLGPEDLHVLRQVEGLELDQFKTITDQLLTRAITDSWARAVILDLVRLPQSPQVTARVRTATLGALITNARRLGKLSADLEREVFAVSAEIPSLPFLEEEPERDYAADDELEDDASPL